jgi:hypothetical protein
MTGPLPGKIIYLDNLRVFLTALVIVHHALVTYGAPGSWYVSDKATDTLTLVLMAMVVATNQAFFMGFFFFIGAFFTEPSYERKGTIVFIKERLIRLALPLLFYSFLFGPFLNFLVAHYDGGFSGSYFDFLSGYDNWIDFGVLWFVAALLFFTLVFAVVRPSITLALRGLPSNRLILAFGLLLGLVSFVTRLFFPVGWTLDPMGWQLGHFPQYVALFCVGIVAWRSKWLDELSFEQGRALRRVPVMMVALGLPLIYVFHRVTGGELSFFNGGWHWQALVYSCWEQITGITLIVVLLAYGKQKWNTASPLAQRLARAAFAVYIIHPVFLIAISLALKSMPVHAALKMLITIVFALPATFATGVLLTRVPGLRRVV